MKRKGPSKTVVMDRVKDMEEITTPESSTVLGATYYPVSQTLRVRFKRKGNLDATYDYEGVPREKWDGFKAADSKGKYLNAFLKETYTVRKIA